MKLTPEAFARALAFIEASARPVDQAWFAMLFQAAPAADLIAAVSAFQNEDGGFGQCYEPDFRLHNSSVMATSQAFHRLIDADAPDDHPVVQKGLAFLLAALDREEMAWTAVPVEVDVVPRAPWWSHAVWKDPGLKGWVNPGADCLATLIHYRSQVPGGIIEALSAKAAAALAVLESPCDMHSFLCWQRLAHAMEDPLRNDILCMLKAEAPKVVTMDEAGWAGYGLRPVWAVESPDDPLYPDLAQAVARNLDYEIEHQQEDGSWAPFWAWGQYEDSWAIARAEWSGHLTVKMLKTLRAFGRIQGERQLGEVVGLA